MIKVTVFRDASGQITAFQLCGHASYADYGKDIVCAAVSVLAQTAIIGLEDYLGLAPLVVIEDGFLECHVGMVAPADSGLVVAILETMVLGLKSIAKEHPHSICIREREV